MNSNLKSVSRSISNGLKAVESKAAVFATDKNVLNIVLIIAVINMIGYLMIGNIDAVMFMAIVGYLSTFFTKNMVIVILIAIISTNFLMFSKVHYFSKQASLEGMQASKEETEETSKPEVTSKPMASDKPTQSTTPKPTKSTKESKKTEGMNGKLAPAKLVEDSDDEPDLQSSSNREVEKMHDSLQTIQNGIETEEVIKQQKVLMDNIKTMQPFLETAERFLDKFNMKGIDGLLGKIGMGSGNGNS